MLEAGKVTKVKVLFLVLVFVFNFDLFKFSAAILFGEGSIKAGYPNVLHCGDFLCFHSMNYY